MSWKSAILALALLTLFLTAAWPLDALAGRTKQPVDWVDPMLGTASSRWMLYPGPSTPFRMVKLSPDNQPNMQWGSAPEAAPPSMTK